MYIKACGYTGKAVTNLECRDAFIEEVAMNQFFQYDSENVDRVTVLPGPGVPYETHTTSLEDAELSGRKEQIHSKQ